MWRIDAGRMKLVMGLGKKLCMSLERLAGGTSRLVPRAPEASRGLAPNGTRILNFSRSGSGHHCSSASADGSCGSSSKRRRSKAFGIAWNMNTPVTTLGASATASSNTLEMQRLGILRSKLIMHACAKNA
jgi:hypothetical protein